MYVLNAVIICFRMRKTACPVVWEGHGAKSPRLDPIIGRESF